MKRSEEFSIIYLLFLVPRILAVLFLKLNPQSKGFLGYIGTLTIFYIITILPALLLSVGFAFLFRKKMATISRLKYYLCLFLVSILSPFIFIAPPIIISFVDAGFSFRSLLLPVILFLNVGLSVVFLHWLFEWVAVDFNNTLRLFLKIFASLLIVLLFTLLLFGTSFIISGEFPFGIFIILITGILASPLLIARKIAHKLLKSKNKEAPEEDLS